MKSDSSHAIPQLDDDAPESTIAEPRTGNVIRRHNGHWTIAYQGCDPIPVTNKAGMFYIAYLIAHPSKKFHVFNLECEKQLWQPRPVGVRLISAGEAETVGCSPQQMQDSGEKLNISELRRELERLISDMSKAEQAGDERAYDRLANERSNVEDWLSKAFDPKGRVRKLDDHEKRVSDKVCIAIKRTMGELESTALGEHLIKSLDISKVCVYRPSPNIEWDTPF